jgi:hypothetical protein
MIAVADGRRRSLRARWPSFALFRSIDRAAAPATKSGDAELRGLWPRARFAG